MSVYTTRNWGPELRRRAEEAERMAQDDYQAHLENLRRSTEIAKEANEGTVIEGVAVRKPQPHLTSAVNVAKKEYG